MITKNLLKPKISAIILLLLIQASWLSANTAEKLKVTHLQCEYINNPQGIDHQSPNLGWVLDSEERGQKQTAYQILVASSEKNIRNNVGDIWNSGKVNSSESSHVIYEGKPLESSTCYYWQVRVWDKNGQATLYSAPSYFGTALMAQDDWKAKWIGRGPADEPIVRWGTEFVSKDLELIKNMEVDSRSTLLRKEFLLGKPVEKVRVHVSGLGLYELYVNGSKIGKTRELVPLKTDYSKQVLYNSYDITDKISRDTNAIGIMLGNGWFNVQKKFIDYRMQWWGSPKAIVQIHVTYEDGTKETIISDQTWKTSIGPVVNSCIYDGEDYDGTLEQPGWDKPGFDDTRWQSVNVVRSPGGRLLSQLAPPITITETINPKSVKEVKPGVFIFDMGQNFAGWTRISCKGSRGTKIQLRHAENINEDGTLNPKTLRNAKNTDTYILKGDGNIEVYEPHFTNHGFQYVEITGYPGKPTLDDVQGRVVHSDCNRTGYFECDNELVNHLYHCAIWTQRSTMQGLPVDCPQRDERLGWGADAHVMAEGGIFNFDSYRFYAKWLRDVQMQQNPETGDLPHISPRPGVNGYPAWSSAYHIINWYSYQYYGDKMLLEKHYENMKRYVDYLQSQSSGHIQPRDKTGDWKSVVPGFQRGGPQLISTAFYYYVTQIVADAAKVLGKTSDAIKYGKMADNIAYAFNNVFQHELRRAYKYGENTQAENATPLFLGIASEKTKPYVLQNLVTDIEEHSYHLTTGFIGSPWVMKVLTDYGREDIAYRLLTQTTYPSWGDMTSNRTTMSESWDASSGSNNHAGLGGSVLPWLFRVLAGINADPKNPGFEKIIIKPYMAPGDLNYVRASTRTIKGLIESSWEKKDGKIIFKVSIPANTYARVYIPTSDPSKVKEGLSLADKSPGVIYRGKEKEDVVYEIESGKYEFVFENIF